MRRFCKKEFPRSDCLRRSQGPQGGMKLWLVPKRRAYDEMVVNRKNSNPSDIGNHGAVS
jgi:hypothetical protein